MGIFYQAPDRKMFSWGWLHSEGSSQNKQPSIKSFHGGVSNCSVFFMNVLTSNQ
jgi:hypothetical protein